MSRKKSVMQPVERDKTWAEKMELKYCRCEHSNTVHAGGLYDCGFIGCTCQEFRERITAAEPPRSFRDVKEIMQGPIV